MAASRSIGAMKERLCKESELIKKGSPSIYKLSLTEELSSGGLVKFCQFGSSPRREVDTKVIMLVGETGVGKTSLINAIVNHMLGVNWEDPYRFKLIQEATENNQAMSQTEIVTTYTINYQPGFSVPYTLKIIDIPGCSNSTGIGWDLKITEQIEALFRTKGQSGVNQLDVVGFVVQSSTNRLSPTQKYLYDSILSLFGKDIETNIVVLLTFCDSLQAIVPQSITSSSIPHKYILMFNNNATFSQNNSLAAGTDDDDDDDDDDDCGLVKVYWQMGTKRLKSFFKLLGGFQSRSLLLCNEVLEERKKLSVLVDGIMAEERLGLNKLEMIRKKKEVVEKHEAEIEANQIGTYVVTAEQENMPSGSYVSYCAACNHTCHDPCYLLPKYKEYCWTLTKGNCRICPGKCGWSAHHSFDFRLTIKDNNVMKTAHGKKQQYEIAILNRQYAEQQVAMMKTEYDENQRKVLEKTCQARESINRLKEIALKPDPLMPLDYINHMIDKEKCEGQ